MRLNHDCIRLLMLEIEEKLDLNSYLSYKTIEELNSVTRFGKENVLYSLQKLKEAGYLKIEFYQGSNNSFYNLSVDAITWEGHKYLDTIRDNEVWKITKRIVSKFSSVSISLVENIAAKVITQLIENQLNP